MGEKFNRSNRRVFPPNFATLAARFSPLIPARAGLYRRRHRQFLDPVCLYMLTRYTP